MRWIKRQWKRLKDWDRRNYGGRPEGYTQPGYGIGGGDPHNQHRPH